MYKKVVSKIERLWLNSVKRSLPIMRKWASRFRGRTNRHVLFEFLVLIVLLSGVGIIAGSRWSATTIASHGNLRVDGVGVYDDPSCSVATAYLDWGTLEPGSVENITIYIRNEGNHVATIFLAAENWKPVNASSCMQLSWNYGGQELNPNEAIEVMLTLSVSSDVENIVDFSFDVIIGTDV